MLVVKVLDLLFIKRRSHSLVLRDEIITSINKRDIIVLINIDSEKVFVLQSFIKDA